MVKKISLILGVCLIAGVGFSADAEARRIQVRLRNFTSGQAFQNPMVAVGPSPATVTVYKLGFESPVSLYKLAEGANCLDVTSLLIRKGAAAVCNNMTVFSEEYIADIQVPEGDIFLTVLAKLNPTNDGIVAKQAFKIPENVVSGVWYIIPAVDALDAGGEYNDELCAHLIAPQACGFLGEGYSDIIQPNQENKVQYHPGLHGEGDLNPAVNNFGTPVGAILYRVFN